MSIESPVLPAAPWKEDWDEVLVRLLATGLSQLANLCAEGVPLRLPYPSSLQRALDRLTVMCLTCGATPPKSVIDLIRWCVLPVGRWPFQPCADGLEADTRFIVDGYPSRECLEWVVASSDVEGEYRQNKLIYEVMDICRSNDRADVYTAFRKLLVEYPALSEQQLATELGRSELVLVANQVRQAYQAPPPEAVIDRVALICRGCGNLLLPVGDAGRECIEPDCTEPSSSAVAHPVDAGVLWVGRELRMFTCAPGRAELRIWRRLCGLGLEVELWPDIDAADLGVRFPDGDVWYVDVKTFSNPAMLARKLKQRPFVPPYGAARSFLVIGREQTRARRSYLDELCNRVPSLKGPALHGEQVIALGEADFVARVERHAAEVVHGA